MPFGWPKRRRDVLRTRNALSIAVAISALAASAITGPLAQLYRGARVVLDGVLTERRENIAFVATPNVSAQHRARRKREDAASISERGATTLATETLASRGDTATIARVSSPSRVDAAPPLAAPSVALGPVLLTASKTVPDPRPDIPDHPLIQT